MPCASSWSLLASIVILASPAVAAPATSPSSHSMLPVPKSAEQGRVDRPLREKYKTEFASRDPKERGDLGRKLREEADKETDPAARFVLLREARDLAVDAGDFSYAMDVVDDIATTFTINAQEMKATALAFGVDKSRVPPEELARNYLKVSDEALAAWNTDLAIKAAYLAGKVSMGHKDIQAEAKEREKVAKIRNRVLLAAIAANQKLEKNPDDPALNQIVGAHVCFNTNRWEQGLPYLVKSPPGPLKTLAERDFAVPADAAAMAALANAWWEFSDPKSNLPVGVGKRRSAYWYKKALPGLSGDEKTRAEVRIAEVEELGKSK